MARVTVKDLEKEIMEMKAVQVAQAKQFEVINATLMRLMDLAEQKQADKSGSAKQKGRKVADEVSAKPKAKEHKPMDAEKSAELQVYTDTFKAKGFSKAEISWIIAHPICTCKEFKAANPTAKGCTRDMLREKKAELRAAKLMK